MGWVVLLSLGTICSSVSSIPYVECLAISPDLVKDDIDDATAGTSTSDIIDWKKTQEKDTRLQYWRKMVETGQKPKKEDTILKRQLNSWSMSRLTLVSVGIRLKPSASALFFPGRYLMLKS
jgi:hypothetical protein